MGGCCSRRSRIAPLQEAQILIPRSQESDVVPTLPVPDQTQHTISWPTSSSLKSDPSNVFPALSLTEGIQHPVVEPNPDSQDSEHSSLSTDIPLLTFPAAEHSPSSHESEDILPFIVEPTLPEPTLPEPTLQKPTLPEPALLEPTLLEPARPQPALPESALLEPDLLEPTLPQPALLEPTLPEPALPQPALPVSENSLSIQESECHSLYFDSSAKAEPQQKEKMIINIGQPTVIRVRPHTEVTMEENQKEEHVEWPKIEVEAATTSKKTSATEPVPEKMQYNNVEQSPQGASSFTSKPALPVPEDTQYLGAEQNRACLKIFKQLIPRQEDAPHRIEVSQILSDWRKSRRLAEIESLVSYISANNTQELAAALTRSGAESTQYLLGLKGDFHIGIAKAYAIYCWVAKNIRYDLASKLKHQHPDPDPEQVMRKREAICHGYANLFLALTEKSGLKSGRIVGHTREWQAKCGCPFEPDDFNSHTWNVVSNL